MDIISAKNARDAAQARGGAGGLRFHDPGCAGIVVIPQGKIDRAFRAAKRTFPCFRARRDAIAHGCTDHRPLMGAAFFCHPTRHHERDQEKNSKIHHSFHAIASSPHTDFLSPGKEKQNPFQIPEMP